MQPLSVGHSLRYAADICEDSLICGGDYPNHWAIAKNDILPAFSTRIGVAENPYQKCNTSSRLIGQITPSRILAKGTRRVPVRDSTIWLSTVWRWNCLTMGSGPAPGRVPVILLVSFGRLAAEDREYCCHSDQNYPNPHKELYAQLRGCSTA